MVLLCNWISNIADRTSYFWNDAFSSKFFKAERLSLLMMKSLGIFLSIIFALIISMEIIVQAVMEHSQYPLPFISHLPFLPATNRVFYIINLVHQIYIYFQSFIFTVTSASFIFTIMIYIYCNLEAVDVLFRHMKEGIEGGSFQKWLKLTASTGAKSEF